MPCNHVIFTSRADNLDGYIYIYIERERSLQGKLDVYIGKLTGIQDKYRRYDVIAMYAKGSQLILAQNTFFVS